MKNELKEVFDIMLTTTTKGERDLGEDSQGQKIEPISEEWIVEVEKLYGILDNEGKGTLDAERV